ncbi:polysaccharide deacetylase family protein [Chromobacterium violaceum]|uniref:polysaccharide deacetylase family protein n=1 Tax=Chromobacterium violaceum TaxID=536 RepID=UPI0005D42B0D|nr:polysaccharide deacetylase family protein [Chromobacterium violaceum]
MKSELSIIMYHYVRQLEETRYPSIKGRRISEFKYQIDHIKKNYHPVTVLDVVNCIRNDEQLPPKAVLLTFDDGYIDHYSNVFPILFDAGIQGAFFPPVGPVSRSELLDVNRIHFTLAVEENHEKLGLSLDEEILAYKAEYYLKSPEEYRAEWAKSDRFDNAETIYVKRMLQVALPEDLRNIIARKLFSKYVSIDEATFAAELYCTPAQLKVMQSSGMYIGSHGDSHYWLDSVDHATQIKEIESSLKFLREVGSPVDDYWVMCYPYGAWSESLLSTLGQYGCSLGLTTNVGKAQVGMDNPLLLPRLDTNDLPIK